MSVAEIRKLVPPPSRPKYRGNPKSWAKFEKDFPYKLPRDYREYIEVYGKGCLGGMFSVYSPFYHKRNPQGKGNFLCCYDLISPDLIELCEGEDWLDESQMNEMPGFILFGGDTNENYLHWVTIGEPDQWPIVVYRRNDWSIHKYDGPFTTFFAGVLKGEVGTDRYSPNIVKLTFRN